MACTLFEYSTFANVCQKFPKGNFDCFEPSKAMCVRWWKWIVGWGKEINIQQKKQTRKWLLILNVNNYNKWTKATQIKMSGTMCVFSLLSCYNSLRCYCHGPRSTRMKTGEQKAQKHSQMSHIQEPRAEQSLLCKLPLV